MLRAPEEAQGSQRATGKPFLAHEWQRRGPKQRQPPGPKRLSRDTIDVERGSHDAIRERAPPLTERVRDGVARSPQPLQKFWDGVVRGRRQDHSRVKHYDGARQLGIARRAIEGDDPADAVPDENRVGQCQLAAQPRDVVGEDAHRIGLMRLVAAAVSPQIRGDDSMPEIRKVAGLGREKGVVADRPRIKTIGRPAPAIFSKYRATLSRWRIGMLSSIVVLRAAGSRRQSMQAAAIARRRVAVEAGGDPSDRVMSCVPCDEGVADAW